MEAFLVLVFLKPTVKEVEEQGLGATVVVQPTGVMAKDSQQAAMKAFRLVPSEDADKGDRLEVRVLPFGK
jgi:hypothetical protein